MSHAALAETSHIGFLVLPNFSMIAFSNALEPLRMANMLAGKISTAGRSSAPGMVERRQQWLESAPVCPVDKAPACDMLIVCSGIRVREAVDEATIAFLRNYAAKGLPIGAICTGTFALAKAGLLNGYRCAIHWENLASIQEEFPKIRFSSDLFVLDRNRLTCSGGTAPLDMMLSLIHSKCGKSLASDISEQFTLERVRDQKDQQHIPLLARIGTGHKTLLDAAIFMEMYIEEPVSLEYLADQVGLSLRQLERLFKRYLDTTPTQHYLALRLRRAREFLLQTNMSLLDVTVACGFQSSSHFCKSYRSLFGYPPSRERSAHRASAVERGGRCPVYHKKAGRTANAPSRNCAFKQSMSQLIKSLSDAGNVLRSRIPIISVTNERLKAHHGI